ncbi:MAG TPA: neutral zinc metallopeptidase [Actinomycetota bacterium]|nr:neutral zinc metallopeptidase [Actinomycetota bacterium]
MRWRRRRRSSDIQDRRGAPGARVGTIGAGLGIPGVIIVLLFMFLGGGDDGGFGDLIGGLQNPRGPAEAPIPRSQDPDADLVDFMSFVLDDAQNFWEDTFAQSNKRYDRAQLVLFEQSTHSACGGATEQIGPHYCPADQKVYLDLDFFRELRRRFGAPGDFAQAYVLAHEIGHHVQKLLGVEGRVRQEQRANPDDANELSVRMELQADCFAGVWAFTTYERNLLESGDLQEGLDAAAAVGDDRIQSQAGERVNPETWTHGSSEQRMEWFRRGFEDGDPNACDTFAGEI